MRNTALQDLPTSKWERWKYSNLPSFVKSDYDDQPLAVGYDGDDAFITDTEMDLSAWAQDTHKDMVLWDGAQDVLNLNVTKDASITLNQSVEDGVKAAGHIYIDVAPDTTVTLVEDFDVQGWCNRSMTIKVNKGAKMFHIRRGKGTGLMSNLTQVEVDGDGCYKSYALNNFGGFTRDQMHGRLMGEKAACYFSGAMMLDNTMHCDTTILVDHMAPDCHSNQNYRNLLNGESRGVFQGKVYVDQIAQLTDGYQLCNTVMLSDKCEMDTKPELEIYADDVQCSHGATTAEMDEEPLFYLMARGISKDQAKAMLIDAFIAESLEFFEDEGDIYDVLEGMIQNARLQS